MRTRFDEELLELNREMIRMGALCENALSETSDALVYGDTEKAKRLPEMLEQVNKKEHDIETVCVRLLLQQQPVAQDLRTISAALKMVTDMERVGDQSADIAEILTMGYIKSIDPELPLRQMSQSVIRMVTEAVDAYVKKDAEAARKVIDYDDVVDEYFNEMKRLLIDEIKRPGSDAESMMDLLMVAKYYERIGDHAVNIASWVIYSVTGSHERVS